MTARSYYTTQSFDLTKLDQVSVAFNAAIKRALDIFFSTLGLMILSPFFILVALKLKSEESGPAFYRGQRIGKDGKEFGILKFRTMYDRPESYQGAYITARDDKRITPTGRWLRDTKLNELPQLWNVLVGEMSMVGPRPEVPEIVKTWPDDLRQEILSVRPGITSPASIAYRDEEKMLTTENIIGDYLVHIVPDKLRLDSLYVRHHTLLTDIDSIFWTIIVLLPRLGETHLPESWLFGGPITRIIRRYISWFVIDFILALVSIAVVGVVWRVNGPLDIGWLPAAIMGISLAFSLSFFNSLLGLKSVSWDRPASEDILKLVISCSLVGFTFFLLHTIFSFMPHLPSEFLLTAVLLVLFSFVVARYRLRLLTGLASRWVSLRQTGYGAGERVLIVGAGEGGDFATLILHRSDFRRYYFVVGIADDDPTKQGLCYEGVKVIGTTGDIPTLVKRHDIGVIFYAINKISLADKERILNTCRRTGLPIILISDVIENLHRQFSKTSILTFAENE